MFRFRNPRLTAAGIRLLTTQHPLPVKGSVNFARIGSRSVTMACVLKATEFVLFFMNMLF
jgi:hypothetical protein